MPVVAILNQLVLFALQPFTSRVFPNQYLHPNRLADTGKKRCRLQPELMPEGYAEQNTQSYNQIKFFHKLYL